MENIRNICKRLTQILDIFGFLRKSAIFGDLTALDVNFYPNSALQKFPQVFGPKAEKLWSEALGVRPQQEQNFVDEVKNWLLCRRAAPDLSIHETPKGIPGIERCSALRPDFPSNE